MSRFHRVVYAPVRVIRRLNDWAESPGSLEGAIRFCDQLLPIVGVFVGSVLSGVILAIVIAACMGTLR